MQFARNAGPLGQALIKTGTHTAGDLSQVPVIHNCSEHNSQREHRREKPARLIKKRLLRNVENHARPVPYSVPIAGPDVKCMRPYRDITVDGMRVDSGIEPLRI